MKKASIVLTMLIGAVLLGGCDALLDFFVDFRSSASEPRSGEQRLADVASGWAFGSLLGFVAMGFICYTANQVFAGRRSPPVQNRLKGVESYSHESEQHY